jgi:hypothetical protein
MTLDRLPIPAERIERSILLLRGEKVMLSPDLAKLYGVGVKVLIQAVKRNTQRFPADFMFQLSREEYSNLKSQFVASSWKAHTVPGRLDLLEGDLWRDVRWL